MNRAERAALRRRQWTGGSWSPGDAREGDRAFWRAASPLERLAAVSELVEEWYRLRNPDGPALRLDRLLAEFEAGSVEYLLVGGHAVAVHGCPRFTKDADLWIGPSAQNVSRAVAALERFGAARAVLEALPVAAELDVVWMGHPPARIDLMKGVPGGDFAACFARRTTVVDGDVSVWVVGREDLIVLKEASGRPQDLEDARQLRDQ